MCDPSFEVDALGKKPDKLCREGQGVSSFGLPGACVLLAGGYAVFIFHTTAGHRFDSLLRSPFPCTGFVTLAHLCQIPHACRVNLS